MANHNPPVNGFDKRPDDGNKNGRPPREWTWKGLLEEAAEEVIELKNNEGVVVSQGKLREVVTKRVWNMAANGDMTAIKEIMNRMDGMPAQTLNHDGEIKIDLPHLYIPEEVK